MDIEKVDIEKFTKLFSSMEKQLVIQSSFLESLYDLTVEEREDRKSRDKLEAIARREDRSQYVEERDTTGGRSKSGKPDEKDSKEQATSLFSGIFGPIAEMIPKILSGLSIAGIGALLIKGGIFAVLAPAIGTFIEDFVETALLDLGASSEAAKSFGSALGRAGTFAALGSIFGKRTALLFGIAGGASSIFDDEIRDLFDSNKDGIVEAFGMQLSADNVVMGIGAALGGALVLVLPKLIPAIVGPMIGLLMGPVGLAAVTAAVIVGGATIFGNYLNDKRAEFIKEIDKYVGQGIEGMKNEKDVGFLNSLGLQMGLTDPSTTTEAMIGLEATASNFKNATARGGRGPLTPTEKKKSEVIDWNTAKKELDPEAYKLLEDQAEGLKKSIKEPGAVIGLTDSKLDQLRRLSVLFGHTENVAIIDKEKAASAVSAEAASREYGEPTYDAMGNVTGYTTPPAPSVITPQPPPTPEAIAPNQSRLDQIEQGAMQAVGKIGSAPSMNSFNSPTNVGGSTSVTNNNSVFNIMSNPSQSLDHMVP
jgi:hypothetical protein